MSDADDTDAVNRAFAELIAGYHLTAERPDAPGLGRSVADAHSEPGSVFELPWPAPEPDVRSIERPSLELPAPRSDDEPVAAAERFDPGPPPPLPRPAWPVLTGWIGLGYAMLTVLTVAVGVDLPAWAAWAGVIGFVGGFGLLVSRLPRHRPPDAGDGAVL